MLGEVLPQMSSEDVFFLAIQLIFWKVLDLDCKVIHLNGFVLKCLDEFALSVVHDEDEDNDGDHNNHIHTNNKETEVVLRDFVVCERNIHHFRQALSSSNYHWLRHRRVILLAKSSS